MANEIKLRFSAAGLREIFDAMVKGGQTGDDAFTKIAAAVDKPNKALLLGQKEIEQYRQAMVAAGSTGSATFARIDGLARQGNPWLLGLDKARSQVGVAVEDLAARAGQGGAILGAMGGGGLLAAAGIGVAAEAVHKLSEMIREYGAEAEDILRVSKAVGVTTDELQGWRHVADEFGISAGSMDAALLGIDQALGAVKSGGRGAAQALQAFGQVGFTRETLAGYDNAAQMIPAIAEGIQKLDDATATRVLQRLHVPDEDIVVFKTLPDDLRRLYLEAGQLGFVLENETLKSLANSNREMRDSKEIISVELAGAFAPFMSKMAATMLQMAGWVATLHKWAQGVKGLLTTAPDAPPITGGPISRAVQTAWRFLTQPGKPLIDTHAESDLAHTWAQQVKIDPPVKAGGAEMATPEEEQAQAKLNSLLAQYVTHTQARTAAEQQLTEIVKAGGVVTDDQRKKILAEADAQDKASAAAKARSAAAPGKRSAQEQEEAERGLDSLRASLIDHTSATLQVEQALAKAREAGGAAAVQAAAVGEQLLEAARAKDAAAQLRRTEQQTLAQIDWTAALTGFSRETRNAQGAEEAIAKAYEAGLSPVQAQIVAVRALAAARDQAAAAARALQAAQPYVQQAGEDVSAGLPDTATATGRFDPAAALAQWQASRAQILADARRLIDQDAEQAIANGTKTRVDAEHDAQEAIRGIDLAYAVQNVNTIADIQRQALKQRTADEQRTADQLKAAFVQGGDDIVSALRSFETNGDWGDLGKSIGRAVMGGLLDALVNDPIRNLIHNAVDSLFSSSSGGGGGIFGKLLRFAGLAISTVTGAPMDLANASTIIGPSSLPVLNTSVPSFDVGVRDFGGGWAKLHADEYLHLPAGSDVFSRPDSQAIDRALSGGGGGGGQGGSSGTTIGAITFDGRVFADGADPAMLQRVAENQQQMARELPQSIVNLVMQMKARGLI